MPIRLGGKDRPPGRRSLAALILFAALTSIPALGQEPSQPALESKPVTPSGQSSSYQWGDYYGSQEQKSGADIASLLEKIEAAIRNLVPEKDETQSQRKEEREVADLDAQQEMARWAECMFWATVATVFLTFAGVVLIAFTLKYTRDAAHYAREMVEPTRRAATATETTIEVMQEAVKQELRAYIVVNEINVSPVLNTATKDIWRIIPRFENSGSTPARHIWFEVYFYKVENGRLAEDFPFRRDGECIGSGTLFLGPGKYSDSVSIDINHFVMYWASTGDNAYYIYGWIDYNDVFEKTPRHRTEFCYQMRVQNPDAPHGPSITFFQTSKHNAADDDCIHEPSPYPLESA